jgi:hypothetical protein
VKVCEKERHRDLSVLNLISCDISAGFIVGGPQRLATEKREANWHLVLEHEPEIVQDGFDLLGVGVCNVEIDVANAVLKQLVEVLLDITPIETRANERLVDANFLAVHADDGVSLPRGSVCS